MCAGRPVCACTHVPRTHFLVRAHACVYPCERATGSVHAHVPLHVERTRHEISVPSSRPISCELLIHLRFAIGTALHGNDHGMCVRLCLHITVCVCTILVYTRVHTRKAMPQHVLPLCMPEPHGVLGPTCLCASCSACKERYVTCVQRRSKWRGTCKERLKWRQSDVCPTRLFCHPACAWLRAKIPSG